MENTENNVQDVNASLLINREIQEYLTETSKWGKFLAIMGYIGIGLIILLAILFMAGASVISAYTDLPFPTGAFGIVYILVAVLYYFPVRYLHQFSNQAKQALILNDQTTLTSGFRNLKSLFKFLGIFTIVILSIYALVLLIAIPVALLAA